MQLGLIKLFLTIELFEDFQLNISLPNRLIELTLDRWWKLPSWSTIKAKGIFSGTVKCIDIKKNTNNKVLCWLTLTLRDDS